MSFVLIRAALIFLPLTRMGQKLAKLNDIPDLKRFDTLAKLMNNVPVIRKVNLFTRSDSHSLELESADYNR